MKDHETDFVYSSSEFLVGFERDDDFNFLMGHSGLHVVEVKGTLSDVHFVISYMEQECQVSCGDTRKSAPIEF